MRDFYKNNSRSILIILTLLVVWLVLYLIQSDKTDEYLGSPKTGDIYILTNDTIYAPMRLDRVEEDQFYMHNYNAIFKEALPKRNQILNIEFDTMFYAVYSKSEIQRLRTSGQITKVYR